MTTRLQGRAALGGSAAFPGWRFTDQTAPELPLTAEVTPGPDMWGPSADPSPRKRSYVAALFVTACAFVSVVGGAPAETITADKWAAPAQVPVRVVPRTHLQPPPLFVPKGFAYVSAANGNWATPTNWTPNGIPGNGDTATVTHTITCTTSALIGASGPAGTAALALNSGGSVTVNGGVTFTTRGDINLNASNFILSAGGNFQFDSSLSPSPSSTSYAVNGGTAHNTSQSFQATGSSGNRCSISSVTTGGAKPGRFTAGTGPWLQGGLMTATYTDFTSIGDTSNDAISFGATAAGNTFSLDNCIFTSCGDIATAYNIADGTTVSITNCSWKTTPGSLCLNLNSPSGITSGTRQITGSVFDKHCQFYPPGGFTYSNCLFDGGFDTTSSQAWAAMSSCLLRTSGCVPFGDMTNCYYLLDSTTDNPHFLTLSSGVAQSMTFDGVFFEAPDALNTTDAGDCVSIPNPSSSTTYTVKRCIVLPAANGRSSGILLSMLGNANALAVVEHNTWFLAADDPTSNKPALGSVGETFNAGAGQVTSFKSNLAASSSSRNAYLFRNINGSPNTDVVSAANADYNLMFNLLSGSAGKGYNAPFSGSPGAHDVNQNPQFVDAGRNFALWDKFNGGAGTYANALAELRKRNDPAGYNSAYSITAAWTFVRDGYAPMNSAIKVAAHDGTTIGAVPYINLGYDQEGIFLRGMRQTVEVVDY